MKLQELGLKTKPADKYKDHLVIRFKTINKELLYKIVLHQSRKLRMGTQWMPIISKEHYDQVLKTEAREVKA